MQMHYKKFGKGQPLIILHGLFGMSDNWMTISKRIAKKHTVFLPDIRNHGLSPHTDDFNYELIAGDLDEFISQQNLNEVRLIGHSMGGKAVMRFSLEFPEKVEKLVLVDIAPKKYEHLFFRNLLNFMVQLDLEKFNNRADIDETFKKVIPSLGVRQFILKNISRLDDLSFEWKINVPALSNNLDEIFAEISSANTFEKPVLVVRGAKSDYVLDEDMVSIKQLFPNADLVTIANAGHWLHVEAEDAFCDQLKIFFQE